MMGRVSDAIAVAMRWSGQGGAGEGDDVSWPVQSELSTHSDQQSQSALLVCSCGADGAETAETTERPRTGQSVTCPLPPPCPQLPTHTPPLAVLSCSAHMQRHIKAINTQPGPTPSARLSIVHSFPYTLPLLLLRDDFHFHLIQDGVADDVGRSWRVPWSTGLHGRRR